MQQGYIEPGVECYVPVGAWEGGGGYSFADRGPTSVEVRQAALDLYLEAQAHAGKDGPWNRAVRVYHAPRGDVQNMLVIERSASATLVKRDAASGEALAGAEFDVVAREDVIAPDGVVQASAGQVMAHVSTGADGTARVSGLPLGSGSATYAFIETKAPAGHVLDATPREFTVSTNGQQASVVTATVEAENEKNSLVVAKGELGREDVTLPGTEFRLVERGRGRRPQLSAQRPEPRRGRRRHAEDRGHRPGRVAPPGEPSPPRLPARRDALDRARGRGGARVRRLARGRRPRHRNARQRLHQGRRLQALRNRGGGGSRGHAHHTRRGGGGRRDLGLRHRAPPRRAARAGHLHADGGADAQGLRPGGDRHLHRRGRPARSRPSSCGTSPSR